MTETADKLSMQTATLHADADIPLIPVGERPEHDRQRKANLYDSPPKSQPMSKNAEAPVYTSPSLDHELTPPRSAISSQEDRHTAALGPQSRHEGVTETTSDGSHTSKAPSRASTGSPSHHDGEAVIWSGPKRTASGQVKRSSITSINDLKHETAVTRASRTSTASSGSVMDLSQQLRTRLNYAMVKVQHGWQNRSFEEVESLASLSPRSSTSGFQHALGRASPPSVVSTDLHRKWSSSTSSEGGETRTPRINGLPANSSGPAVQQDSNMSARRALAPPVDIIPGQRRRPTADNFAPSIQYDVSPAAPRLSNGRPTPKHRTPSQNAAMEADAVETLLFMASPNNSGHPATFTPQESSLRSTQLSASQTSHASPLRSQFNVNELLPTPKRVAFAGTTSLGKPYDKIADIERILDQFSDDESGDDLEEAFKISQRHQQAAV